MKNNHDHSERLTGYEAEESLSASEVRYRRLFEAARDGILILDAETGMIDDVNPFLVELLGFARERFLGKKIWELGFFRDIVTSQTNFLELQEKEYIRYEDLPLETADGRRIEVEFVSNVYLVDQKKVIQCNIRDITKRKLEEEKSWKLGNSVQEEKDRLSALLNSISDEVWFADTRKKFILANSSARQEFGIDSKDEIDVEKFAGSLEVYRPDGSLRPVEEAAPLKALKGEIVKNQEEIIRTPATGELRYRQVSASPVRDSRGSVIGSVSVVRDITELKRAEGEIKKLNAELEQRVVERTAQLDTSIKELEAFSYSVSHDLRSPLRAIDGFSRILLEEYNALLDEEGKRLLAVVRSNTKRMAQLIDDLLAFSRMNRKEMIIGEINMERLARSVIEELKQSAGERTIEVTVGQLPTAFGDSAMIRQVFANLLSNAFKFTRNTDRAVVQVEGRVENGENIYSVCDNGVGFDMEYKNKLFGVFQRLHSQDEFEGTGVGLAIVQRIVHRHDGRVWGEGMVNGGACFSFALPGKSFKGKE